MSYWILQKLYKLTIHDIVEEVPLSICMAEAYHWKIYMYIYVCESIREDNWFTYLTILLQTSKFISARIRTVEKDVNLKKRESMRNLVQI